MTKTLDDIYERLGALESVVLGRKDSARLVDQRFDRRLTKGELALRRGKSTRTIDRDVARGVLPRPEIENGRCYWWLSILQRHESENAREAAAARSRKRNPTPSEGESAA